MVYEIIIQLHRVISNQALTKTNFLGACSHWKMLQLTISGHLKMENGSKQHIPDKISQYQKQYSSTGVTAKMSLFRNVIK